MNTQTIQFINCNYRPYMLYYICNQEKITNIKSKELLQYEN